MCPSIVLTVFYPIIFMWNDTWFKLRILIELCTIYIVHLIISSGSTLMRHCPFIFLYYHRVRRLSNLSRFDVEMITSTSLFLVLLYQVITLARVKLWIVWNPVKVMWRSIRFSFHYLRCLQGFFLKKVAVWWDVFSFTKLQRYKLLIFRFSTWLYA